MSNTSLEIIKNRPRNLIINGGFDHWQRGTYFTGHGYGPDRWNYNYSLAGFAHGSGKDSTDQPNGQFCHALNVVTPASPGPADWCALSHRIEGRDLVGLIGKKFVFSADFKTTVAGTYYISFANHNITRRLYKPITLQANVWERKHVVIEFDTQLSSWNFDNTVGMYVEIMLATGSNYIGTGDGTNWADGNLGKADQVNFTNNAAAIFRTNNVMLHEGEYPLDFYPSGNTYAEELRLCQRYFETSYDTGVAIGTPNQHNGVWNSVSINAADFYDYGGGIRFGITKRAIPVVTLYNPVSGASGNFYCYSISATSGNSGFSEAGTGGIRRIFSSNSGMVIGRVYGTHWVVDAEL